MFVVCDSKALLSTCSCSIQADQRRCLVAASGEPAFVVCEPIRR